MRIFKLFLCRRMSSLTKVFQRLPNDVHPINYKLKLTPDLKKFVFDGYEEVKCTVNRAVNQIVLNSYEISIKEVRWVQNGADVEGSISYCEEEQKATFKFPKTLTVGEGTLKVAFKGILNDRMKGFYRSSYRDDEGVEHQAATSQFEPTDARLAFPCWDEPAVKATFDVTLVVDTSRVALSNMPVIKEEIINDLKTVTYDTTPIMSTYLLAFVVGDFDFVEDVDANGVKIRVYTQRGKKEQGRFALDVTKRTLPFYKDYFGIAYPLPKQDLIAIPDFAAGAMENWGLVTYRETALLVDEGNTALANKQTVALVVTHEMAHQWFGNLVTMEWWTHLWLNEGFATWVEFLCVDFLFPEWDIWSQFLSDQYAAAARLDALENSHPVEVPVNNPSEIDEIFDQISYCKGASIIGMMHDFIGDEAFRSGLHQYLTDHSYSNAVTEALWAALSKASGKNVANMMSGFTSIMGYPVLNAELKPNGKLQVSQKRFILNGSADKHYSMWNIPLTVSMGTRGSSGDGEKRVLNTLLTQESDVFDLGCHPGDNWVKINCKTVGFYRVSYSEEMLNKLTKAIQSKSVSNRDRFGLQNDLVAVCESGNGQKTSQVLKFLLNYKNETDFRLDSFDHAVVSVRGSEKMANLGWVDKYDHNLSVWCNVAQNHSLLGILVDNAGCSDGFKRYTIDLFTPLYERLGFDAASHDDGPSDPMLRGLVMTKLGYCGHAAVLSKAKMLFDSNANIEVNCRSAIYGINARFGDATTYEELLKRYRSTDLQEEKVRVLKALGQFKQADLKKKYLAFSISKEVRPQDSFMCVAAVANTIEGRQIAWDWVKEHWEFLVERYTSGFLIGRFIKGACNDMFDSSLADDIDRFFIGRQTPGSERTIQQVLENVRTQANWLERDRADIQQYFSA